MLLINTLFKASLDIHTGTMEKYAVFSFACYIYCVEKSFYQKAEKQINDLFVPPVFKHNFTCPVRCVLVFDNQALFDNHVARFSAQHECFEEKVYKNSAFNQNYYLTFFLYLQVIKVFF